MHLSGAVPSSRFARVIENTDQSLYEILYHGHWVWTHSDLSDMDILVDPDSGHLTGVIDRAHAGIGPFGIALWGLESVLGSSGPYGWSYFRDEVLSSRKLFREMFLKGIGMSVSVQTCRAIEEARTLGVLLRYDFFWEDGRVKPTRDTSVLDVFPDCEPAG